ncbi:hypothetical protein SAY87_024855 [Trapa incisa]|uniref:Late embryogenesis abundant protein LEA-2 subgroup domain-containing protein n=1 Tax=Trapa incisa TaxID=236973 RepID=A0AAN7GRM0_9MYRT|nr:hypothetical protein SAY87_024855 [Trapa incisa]
MTPKKYVIGSQGRHTHPLIWCAAIICAILAIAVIVVGIIVFVGYIIVHPRIPFISVLSASLDTFRYDETGLLVTQVTIDIRAENDNAKAHASYQDVSFFLIFGGMEIAKLVAYPFDVVKSGKEDFHFVVESRPIPLDPKNMELASLSLRQDDIAFDLKGKFRAQWRVGLLGSVKFWCHLDCKFHFHPSNLSYTSRDSCTSRAKSGP